MFWFQLQFVFKNEISSTSGRHAALRSQLDPAYPRLLVFRLKLCCNTATMRATGCMSPDIDCMVALGVSVHFKTDHSKTLTPVCRNEQDSRRCEAVRCRRDPRGYRTFTDCSPLKTCRCYGLNQQGWSSHTACVPALDSRSEAVSGCCFFSLSVCVLSGSSSGVLKRPGTRALTAVTQRHVQIERGRLWWWWSAPTVSQGGNNNPAVTKYSENSLI